MFYFIHVLAGAVIAKYFPSIIPIIILSIIFHFLLDIIPHRDSLFTKKVFKKSYKIRFNDKAVLFETIKAFLTFLFIIYIQIKFKSSLMLFSIFISLLPDIVKIGYLTRLRDNKIFKNYIYFHSRIQTIIPWVPGILIQLIVSLILIKLLF